MIPSFKDIFAVYSNVVVVDDDDDDVVVVVVDVDVNIETFICLFSAGTELKLQY